MVCVCTCRHLSGRQIKAPLSLDLYSILGLPIAADIILLIFRKLVSKKSSNLVCQTKLICVNMYTYFVKYISDSWNSKSLVGQAWNYSEDMHVARLFRMGYQYFRQRHECMLWFCYVAVFKKKPNCLLSLRVLHVQLSQRAILGRPLKLWSQLLLLLTQSAL